MRNPLRRKSLRASASALDAFRESGVNFNFPANPAISSAYFETQAASYAHLYRTQPNVRMVVDFMARNISQLALKLYVRDGDGGRDEDREHAAALLMRQPNDWTSGEKFISDMVADYFIHENAYALKLRDPESGKISLLRVPAHAVGVQGTNQFRPVAYQIIMRDGSRMPVAVEDMLHWKGYNPDNSLMGVSRLETLRKVLVEEAVNQAASTELAKTGWQGGIIERPLEAPEWSDEARERFEEGLKDRAGAMRAGEWMLLEEGMQIADPAISPKQAQLLESREFSIAQICRVYGLPLGLFDLEQGELDSERKMLYADVLPPIASQLAGVMNMGILRDEYGARNRYFEFLIDSKLEGDLENQLAQLVTVTGRPLLTTNEGRKLKNLPPIDGGDELVTPMNVIVGENPKPSPNTMPVPDPNTPAQDGSAREGDAPAAKVDPTILKKNIERLIRSVKSTGKEDADRWVREIMEDIDADQGV